MNMKANRLILPILLATAVSLSSCRDKFAEINQNPSTVTKADPSYLMAEAIRDFQTNDYLLWFYNAKYFGVWDQMCATGAFSENSTEMNEAGGQGSQYLTMLRYRNDINNIIKDNHPEYGAYSAVCDILAIYCGIFDTDIYGDIPYSEAAMYRYGGTLTPKYDRVDSLYTGWIQSLDNDIKTFQDSKMQFIGTEDVVYKGDLTKWAKLANSIKLKIAARMYNNKPAEAISIVESVASSQVGYIDDDDQNFMFNKADVVTSGDGDIVYQTGNDLQSNTKEYASANVINFMRENKDPRIRFIYTKNGFNSKIVQGFIDAGKVDSLPTYTKEHIVFDDKGNFKEWKAPGEPWVRYIGMPMVLKGSAEYNKVKSEFFVTTDRYVLKNETTGTTIKYENVSRYNDEMRRGRCTYTIPTLPGDKVIEDKDQIPWWGMYLTSAETNLYLAEFSLLGAKLSKSANEYYTRGVNKSLQEYNLLAAYNKIPYYGTTYDYDPNEKTINLIGNEIDEMLAQPGVKLTGSTSEQLEKVYLQQMIHFSMQPDEHFVTARRSGYPKKGSALLPFEDFGYFTPESIPRRFQINPPSPTDIMYDIKVEAYKTQGLTPGTNQSKGNTSTVLNTERLWQDQNGPQWGTPKQ